MKVRELIAQLEKLDPELPVWVHDHEGNMFEAESVDFVEGGKAYWWPYPHRPDRILIWD